MIISRHVHGTPVCTIQNAICEEVFKSEVASVQIPHFMEVERLFGFHKPVKIISAPLPMTDNSPDGVNFKFSTYNDYETEYSEALKKAAKEVNLNVSEKLAISLRPLFRKKWALMHITTGLYVTVLFFLYCLVCALIFKSFEGEHYMKTMLTFTERKQEMRNKFSQVVCRTCSDSELCVNKSLLMLMIDDYEGFLSEYSLQFRDEKYPWPWTLGHSFSFVIWVYSTIGDGKMYPITPMGRIFCMVSALMGIPFFLYVITYYGRAINEFFKLIYNHRNFLYRYPSVASSSQLEEFEQTTTKPKIDREPPTYSLKFDRNEAHENELEVHLGVQPADLFISALPTSNPKAIESSNRQDVKIPLAETVVHFSYLDWKNRFPDHIYVLPTSAAFVILCLYILMGALIIENRFEDWNFLTSFYYLFITMSTIGFGDVDPWTNLNFAHYFYIVLGIAMFAMVLESIKVTFSENFKNGMQKVLRHLKVIPLMENIIIIPNELSTEEMNLHQEKREKRNL